MADQKDMKLTGLRMTWTDGLFEAKGWKGSQQNKKYKHKFLVPKDSANANTIKAKILEVAKAKWPKDYEKVLAQLQNSDKFCFRDGDLKDTDGFAGNYILSASNKRRPRLVRANRDEITEDDGTFYSGCYAIARVNIYAFEKDGSKFISCDLNGVQFFKDGEAFSGGRISSIDDFDEIPEEAAGSTLSANSTNFM